MLLAQLQEQLPFISSSLPCSPRAMASGHFFSSNDYCKSLISIILCPLQTHKLTSPSPVQLVFLHASAAEIWVNGYIRTQFKLLFLQQENYSYLTGQPKCKVKRICCYQFSDCNDMCTVWSRMELSRLTAKAVWRTAVPIFQIQNYRIPKNK